MPADGNSQFSEWSNMEIIVTDLSDEWPTERGNVNFDEILTVVPCATSPAVFFSERARAWSHRLVVDLDLIARELEQAGIPSEYLKSLAVKLWHPSDVADHVGREATRQQRAEDHGMRLAEQTFEFFSGVEGWYSGVPFVQDAPDGDGEIWYRLALNVAIKPRHMQMANFALWHESGHAWLQLTGRIPSDRKALYNRPGLVRFAARFHSQPLNVLWLLDREERQAQAFARKRRHLQPIEWRR